MALRCWRRTLRSAAEAFFQLLAAPVTRDRCFSNLAALATTVLVRVVIREAYSFLALVREALVAAVRSLANLRLWAAASARPTASWAEALMRMSLISLAAIFLFWLNRARRKPRARLLSVWRLSARRTMRLRDLSVSALILAWVALSDSTMAVTAWRWPTRRFSCCLILAVSSTRAPLKYFLAEATSAVAFLRAARMSLTVLAKLALDRAVRAVNLLLVLVMADLKRPSR